MIARLNLKNFTAFTDLDIKFVPGINIIIGENGTGKTQLLKAIYALCCEEGYLSAEENSGVLLAKKLCRLYQPLAGIVGGLRRSGVRGGALIYAQFSQGQSIVTAFNGTDTDVDVKSEAVTKVTPAVFIPTKEVLSLVAGLSDAATELSMLERIFDDTYLDLVKLMLDNDELDEVMLLNDPRLLNMIQKITKTIGGKFTLADGRFVFQPGLYGESTPIDRSKAKQALLYADNKVLKFKATSKENYSSNMTAEGFRKIGVIQRLLQTGSLHPGKIGVLLWDEPESNINPQLMRQVVELLLELARNGQQIILATHDYVLLKWFDLLHDVNKGDQVAYHVLFNEGQDNITKYHFAMDYYAVENNAIAVTYNDLMMEQVNKKMGGLGK